MRITLNGQKIDFPEKTTLKMVIEEYCRDIAHIVAEVNGQIIRNQQWEARCLTEGDTVELVNIVGGG